MKSLWFIVPAHGRHEMARVCLRQLRRTCEALRAEHGIDAYAVVITDDGYNGTAALECGHGLILRENKPLGRKWNDGYELAGREGVDFVVPLGTDDWVDPLWVSNAAHCIEEIGLIGCSRKLGMVREDGQKIARVRVPYEGGHGIRVIPTELLRPLGYRPATEDAPRAIDTHVLRNIRKTLGGVSPIVYMAALHDFPVVDWKSGTQLNTYEMCAAYRVDEQDDPFAVLAGIYPAEALEEMRGVYSEKRRRCSNG